MLERITLTQDTWALQVSDGMLVGRGMQVRYRMKGGPVMFELWRALHDLLAMDGGCVNDLVQALSTTFPPGLVRDIIPHLLRVGLVTPDVPNEDVEPERLQTLRQHPLWSYLASQSPKPWVHLERLLTARVGMIAELPIVEALRESFRELGIPVAASIKVENGRTIDEEEAAGITTGVDFLIAVARDPIARLQLFPAINLASRKAKRPWIAAHLAQNKVAIGPLFVPDETACFNCLELREESHLPNLRDYRELRSLVNQLPTIKEAGLLPGAVGILVRAVTIDVVRGLSEIALPPTYRALIEFDLATFETRRHVLLRVPLCDVCGPHVDRPFRRAWSL